MRFFTKILVGMIIGGIIGGYFATSVLPLGMFETNLAYIKLPLIGEVNRIVLFLTGILAVIGGSFAAFLG